jgi:HlyD family secretion protein
LITTPALFRLAATVALLALALATPRALAQTTPAQPAPTQPTAGQLKPPTITVARVAQGEIVSSIIVAGTIVAREEVLVVPEVDGLSIVALAAEEGDRVAAGQVLARLNRAALDVSLAQNAAQAQRVNAAIAQARAQIVEAEANRVQSANALGRAQTLRSEGITSADILDQRVATARGAEARLNVAREALASAQAELASTQAQRAEIELRIQRSEIKAPRAGVVSRRNARIGAIASAGSPEPLFRIIADGALELEAEIPEADLPRLKLGADVQVTPAGGARPISGAVRLISPEVDRQTRLGRARIALPEAGAPSVGVFARGMIELERRNGLTAPLSAVTFRRDAAFVQVVENNVVRARQVRTGVSGDGRVELLEGVSAGDLIVARAGTFLRDGDIIAPVLPATN